jgi:uncharacterized membrane protein
MILHVAATAPFAVRALSDLALGFHLGGATTGLAAGTVAMVAHKGGRLHRLSGNVFFFAMLAMSGVGAVVAPMIDDIGSAFAGAITFYLVLTGWLTARQPVVKAGPLQIAGVALLGVAVAVVSAMGLHALADPDKAHQQVPWFAYFVIAAIASLIGVLDLKVILGPALTGPQRLARHVWRMGLSLLIALMSGLAQPKASGLIFHGAFVQLQWIPVAALVLSLAYWIIRVRRPGLFKARNPRPAISAAPSNGVLS